MITWLRKIFKKDQWCDAPYIVTARTIDVCSLLEKHIKANYINMELIKTEESTHWYDDWVESLKKTSL